MAMGKIYPLSGRHEHPKSIGDVEDLGWKISE